MQVCENQQIPRPSQPSPHTGYIHSVDRPPLYEQSPDSFESYTPRYAPDLKRKRAESATPSIPSPHSSVERQCYAQTPPQYQGGLDLPDVPQCYRLGSNEMEIGRNINTPPPQKFRIVPSNGMTSACGSSQMPLLSPLLPSDPRIPKKTATSRSYKSRRPRGSLKKKSAHSRRQSGALSQRPNFVDITPHELGPTERDSFMTGLDQQQYRQTATYTPGFSDNRVPQPTSESLGSWLVSTPDNASKQHLHNVVRSRDQLSEFQASLSNEQPIYQLPVDQRQMDPHFSRNEFPQNSLQQINVQDPRTTSAAGAGWVTGPHFQPVAANERTPWLRYPAAEMNRVLGGPS